MDNNHSGLVVGCFVDGWSIYSDLCGGNTFFCSCLFLLGLCVLPISWISRIGMHNYGKK